MQDVAGQARALGLPVTGVRCGLSDVARLDAPAIAHVDGKHFLVVDRVSTSHVRVLDGPMQVVTLDRADFEKRFTGFALIPTEALAKDHGPPAIRADSYIVDVGEVPANSRVARSFVLRAAGPAPILIKEVRSCCGSEVKIAAGTVIQPGASLEAPVEVIVPNGSPVLDRTVTLVTDAPRWPVVNLTIVGRVLEDVFVVPQVIDFGRVKMGAKVEKQISLMRVGPDLEKAATFSSGSEFLSAARTEYDAASRTLRATVRFEASGPRGRFKDKVVVRLGSGERAAQIEAPVFAEVAGAVAVSPGELMIGLIRKASGGSAKVTLARGDGRPFSILSASGPAGVPVSWSKAGDGWTVEASVGPNPKWEVLDDFVTITTDVAEDREVRIPIYAAIEPE